MFRTLLILTLISSVPAFAQRKGGPPGPGGRGGGGMNPACASVRAACEKAGFTKGKGGGKPVTGSKGSIRDCMQKWGNGEPVPGVSLKPTDPAVKECVEHMKQMKERRGGRGGRGGSRGDGPEADAVGMGASNMAKPAPPAPTSAPKVLPAVPVAPQAPATPPPKKP